VTPVFLVGMPGAGKSTVGRVLARSLDAVFIDLDDRIEMLFGASIARLFSPNSVASRPARSASGPVDRSDLDLRFEHGEPAFRASERAALRSLVDEPGFAGAAAVVATGGGVVCDADNLEVMRGVGRLVYLEVDIETLQARLCQPAQRGARPLLARTSLAELLAARESAYRHASLIVDGRGQPDRVAAEIRQLL
jgi:shikimate kinase